MTDALPPHGIPYFVLIDATEKVVYSKPGPTKTNCARPSQACGRNLVGWRRGEPARIIENSRNVITAVAASFQRAATFLISVLTDQRSDSIRPRRAKSVAAELGTPFREFVTEAVKDNWSPTPRLRNSLGWLLSGSSYTCVKKPRKLTALSKRSSSRSRPKIDNDFGHERPLSPSRR